MDSNAKNNETSNSTIIEPNFNFTEIVSNNTEESNDTIHMLITKNDDISSYSPFYSLSSVILIAVLILIVIVVLIARKKRLDKIRHHLMPVYNYSASQDGEDWETELLDESVTSSLTKASNVNKLRPLYTCERPQLSFARV
jgi:hypothetical protein